MLKEKKKIVKMNKNKKVSREEVTFNLRFEKLDMSQP